MLDTHALAVFSLLAVAPASAQTVQLPDPDLGKRGAPATPPVVLAVTTQNAGSCVTIDAVGPDTFNTPDFYVFTNNTSNAIDSINLDLSPVAGAFWDFDGGSTFMNATEPVITSISGMNAADVTFVFVGTHPTDFTIQFNPAMPPGAILGLGADTDFFVSDPCPGDNFAGGNCLVDLTYVTGASCIDEQYALVGFQHSEAQCCGGGPGTIGTSYCGPAIVNSTGGPASITASGSTVAANDDVTLTCDGMPQNQFGYFLNSQTQSFVFPVPNSQGALCLGGQIGRYLGGVFNSGATGSGSLVLDLPNTPTPVGTVPIMAGETWNFTTWYRDMNPSPTSNFSDGVEILFN